MSDGYRVFERNSDFWDEEEITETECDSCIHKVSKEDVDALIQQGREEERAKIITIIEQMKESASAMMWTEREVACEKILEQIKEDSNV